MSRAFEDAVERAGIRWESRDDKPTFHSLRHGFASAIIAGGADQGHVARLLSHTDPAFTYKVFVHEFDQALQAGGIEGGADHGLRRGAPLKVQAFCHFRRSARVLSRAAWISLRDAVPPSDALLRGMRRQDVTLA